MCAHYKQFNTLPVGSGGPTLGTTLLSSGGGGFWPVAASCAAIDVALVTGLEATSRRTSISVKGKIVEEEGHSD